MDELAAVADDDFCYLTTLGRVSGRPHEIEIWFALDGRTLYLLSGGGDRSDWVRNLRADPSVAVRLRDTTYPAMARIVEAGEESERGRRLVFDKYQPRYSGSLERWRRESLLVALDVRLSIPVVRFSLVTVFVEDPTPLRDWYTGTLGLTVSSETARFVQLADDTGRPCVAFHVGRPVVHAEHVQLHFEVDDVDAEYERLRAAGVAFHEPPADKPWGWRVAALRDPAGHTVELVRPI
jgi:deazaflavin-dependent oxidoreductase (nitroreductase family)